MIQALFLTKKVDKWSDLEELKESCHPSSMELDNIVNLACYNKAKCTARYVAKDGTFLAIGQRKRPLNFV